MDSLSFFLKNPRRVLAGLLYRFGSPFSDETYIKWMFYSYFGKFPNLKDPITFNEKLQWLKLHDRKDIYTTMVDKIEVKKWVADKIGQQYIIPTLAVYERAEDIDFDSLPDKFVLKCNHDSGGLCICTDKSKLDFDKVRADLNRTLKRNYYLIGREWPYKNVKRRILAEQYIVDESGYELKDYKIFCFNGTPRFIQVDFDRFAKSGHKRNLYDTDWNLLKFDYGYPSDASRTIARPDNLEEMLQLAERLSEGHVFLRVDFYAVNGKTSFGETTFFPESGIGHFTPSSKDAEIGDKIKLTTCGGGKLTHNNKRAKSNIRFGEITFYPGCGLEAFSSEDWDTKLGEWIGLTSTTLIK